MADPVAAPRPAIMSELIAAIEDIAGERVAPVTRVFVASPRAPAGPELSAVAQPVRAVARESGVLGELELLAERRLELALRYMASPQWNAGWRHAEVERVLSEGAS